MWQNYIFIREWKSLVGVEYGVLCHLKILGQPNKAIFFTTLWSFHIFLWVINSWIYHFWSNLEVLIWSLKFPNIEILISNFWNSSKRSFRLFLWQLLNFISYSSTNQFTHLKLKNFVTLSSAGWRLPWTVTKSPRLRWCRSTSQQTPTIYKHCPIPSTLQCLTLF